MAQVRDRDYDASIERVIVFHIEGWDWNCPQHIPIRYSEMEMEAMQARIAELEQLLAESRNSTNSTNA